MEGSGAAVRDRSDGEVRQAGVVGVIGRLLGEADVNIGGMQVARDDAAGLALVALTVDNEIPGAVVHAIASEVEADVRVVDLAQ